MTRGEIAQLQELSKCYGMNRKDATTVQIWLSPFWATPDERMNKFDKAWLRRLTHQYRGQIAAMKRNRGKA
jgi:cyclopropane fatty-acyl-phospholipid synthase-like methyltransferase